MKPAPPLFAAQLHKRALNQWGVAVSHASAMARDLWAAERDPALVTLYTWGYEAYERREATVWAVVAAWLSQCSRHKLITQGRYVQMVARARAQVDSGWNGHRLAGGR